MTIQAQIDAAARAMTECMFAPHELPITGELWEKYLWTAKAALTAAAEVGPNMKPLTDDEADAIKDAIRLARQSERDRCAEVAENWKEWDDRPPSPQAIAAAIRALKDEPPAV
jgi:hypothetical protein